ncbi:MAG: hypothetical protein ACJ8G3_16305, partial [Burkholderiaceae bacterium]
MNRKWSDATLGHQTSIWLRPAAKSAAGRGQAKPGNAQLSISSGFQACTVWLCSPKPLMDRRMVS